MRLELTKVKTWAQVRAAINQEVVSQYAQQMQDAVVFPSIVVFFDGTDYHLADGFHRVAAARQCGFVDIESMIEDGTAADALWFALTANQTHGLRMSRADVRHAVGLALRNFPEKSNREIARQIGCSDKTVADVRAELESTAEIPQLEKTTGADGKSRSAKRKPRVKPADLPAADPGSVSCEESNLAPDEPVDQDNEQAGEKDEDNPDAAGPLPIYNVIVSGRNINSVRKTLTTAFGADAVLAVEKRTAPKSRRERLDQAAGLVEDAKAVVEELAGEIENWRDGLPENLQDSDKANQLSECSDQLQEITGALEEIDFSAVEFPGMY